MSENQLEQKVRDLAFSLWATAGTNYGLAIDYWIMAERMVVEATSASAQLTRSILTSSVMRPSPTEMPPPVSLNTLCLQRTRELAQAMMQAAGARYASSLEFWIAAEKHMVALLEKSAVAAGSTVGAEKAVANLFAGFSAEDYLERVRLLAYKLWEAAGRPHDDPLTFWLRAEAEMLRETPAPTEAAPQPTPEPEPEPEPVPPAEEPVRPAEEAHAGPPAEAAPVAAAEPPPEPAAEAASAASATGEAEARPSPEPVNAPPAAAHQPRAEAVAKAAASAPTTSRSGRAAPAEAAASPETSAPARAAKGKPARNPTAKGSTAKGQTKNGHTAQGPTGKAATGKTTTAAGKTTATRTTAPRASTRRTAARKPTRPKAGS